MSSFADSIDGFSGGLVVSTGGGDFTKALTDVGDQFSNIMSCLWRNKIASAIIIVGVMVLIVFTGVCSAKAGFRSGFSPAHNQRFATGHSATGLTSSFTQRDRPAEYLKKINGFMNNSEAPYYPDVTNRVLHMENREKEAMRALGKINQERLRRAADDTSSTTPLPWDAFWSEWKKTHPMDGEDVASGFRGDGSLMPNY